MIKQLLIVYLDAYDGCSININSEGKMMREPPGNVLSTITAFPDCIPVKYPLLINQLGYAYAVIKGQGNPYALRIGSKAFDALIYHNAHDVNRKIRKQEVAEISEYFTIKAELSGVTGQVWTRTAKIDDGIEIDLGDEDHIRIKITASNGVEIISEGSTTLFCRNAKSLPIVKPDLISSDLQLLKKYINLNHVDFMLYLAFITYSIANPKTPSSNYVMMVLNGHGGSGKSFATRTAINLIDPSSIGVQIFPKTTKELAIATQNSHVVGYDNMRNFSAEMSDTLCVACTGGFISSRALYTNDEQSSIYLHAALVLNGLSNLVNYDDLAQRSLILHMKPLPHESRLSALEINDSFNRDLPKIMGGLYQFIANVLAKLPDAEVVHPERMLDFSKWLAAMEIADAVPQGIYQYEYSENIINAHFAGLSENLLGAAVIELVESLNGREWEGTPTALLHKLAQMDCVNPRSSDWPNCPIKLSKRLKTLSTAFLTQGISIAFHHGKERVIRINKL
jgi:hypothetical protein